jgi:ABC-2 type transport system ATP-binding protein
VLFLDEPTTGLDPASRRDVWDLIHALVNNGTTVLLTTQYLEEADHLADRITVIDAGRVVPFGPGRTISDIATITRRNCATPFGFPRCWSCPARCR